MVQDLTNVVYVVYLTFCSRVQTAEVSRSSVFAVVVGRSRTVWLGLVVGRCGWAAVVAVVTIRVLVLMLVVEGCWSWEQCWSMWLVDVLVRWLVAVVMNRRLFMPRGNRCRK
jgi:uncharacterized membrane protein YgaE (UPF0421/DUF939 family)